MGFHTFSGLVRARVRVILKVLRTTKDYIELTKMANFTIVEAVGHLAMALVHVLSNDSVASQDLTIAGESVSEWKFDVFNDKFSYGDKAGISLAEFETLVSSITMEFPEDVRQAFLESSFSTGNGGGIHDFKFTKGETGSFTYVLLVTVQGNNTTDLDYCVYNLKYKLSPRVIKHTKTTEVLGITISKDVWKEEREISLSPKEQDSLRSCFLTKAVNGCKEKYAVVLDRSTQHRDEL